jgi:hypothetical protein
MSGLLHRLAQRTLNGNAPRVRPVAPIPWLATPGIFEAAESATPAPEPAVPHTRTPSPVAPFPDAPDAAPRETPDASSPEPPVVPTPAVAATAHEETEAPPAPTFVEPDHAPPGAPTAFVTQHNPPATTMSTDAPTAAPRSYPASARRLPPALLAPRPDAQADPALPRIRPHVAVAAPVTEPPTEVHVHIGRVELTAVTESPPPQRKARPASTGRSLDEYLQQRKERLG